MMASRTVLSSLLVTLATCTSDDGTTGRATDGTTASGDPPPASPTDSAVDSTGAPLDPACIDDYHGNQDPQAALDLVLETTDTAVIVLGDGLAADPPELGTDQLVVCEAAPSDFFVLEAQCPGFLGIEARTLGGGVPELLLYEGTILPGDQPVEQAVGDWYGFFLKPLQWEVDPGSYVIEVRHSGGGSQPYSLAVALLPDSPCPPP